MADNGYVYAFRRAWTHRACRDLLDGAIWNYIYQNAAWKDTTVYERGVAIPLTRGQIFVTIRSLAEGFHCSQAKIRGCTDRLSKEAMIVAHTTQLGCVITVCNYDQYQCPPDEDGAQMKHTMLHKKSTDRSTFNKEEENQVNQTPPYPPEFEEFWSLFPKQRIGNKQNAFRAWKRAITRVVPATIIAGTQAYAVSDEVARQFAKGPAPWLNNDGWASVYTPSTPALEAAFVEGVRPSWG